jgi:excisionase family DNA binding protein
MTPSQPVDAQQLFLAFMAAARAQVQAESQPIEAKPAVQTRLLTPAEAGKYLGRTEKAVRQLIYQKRLPVIKFGKNVRLDIRDLEKIVEDNRV